MVEEILQLRWRLPALAGESIELTPTHPGGAVGGQGECGQSQSGGQGGREGQRDGAQRPLGGADARGASGILMEDGGIEQLRLDGEYLRLERCSQPACSSSSHSSTRP